MSTFQDSLGLGLFFGLGALAHVAERRWPLRTYEKPKAVAIDTVGFVVSAVATAAFRKWVAPLIGNLPALTGFGWTAGAAQFVDATVPWPVAFVVSVVVLDFLLYVGHPLLHTGWLWHTHAVHHSVEHLYWFGGNRSSPFHVMLQLCWGVLLGLVWPVHGGMSAFVATLIVYTCIQHFNHANIRWRLAASATRRFSVMTPFVDEDGAERIVSLFQATRPGVARELVVRNGLPDALAGKAGELKALGVAVYDFRIPRPDRPENETFHAKVVRVDDSECYAGSSNMTKWSFEYSLELGFHVRGAAAAKVSRLLDAVVAVSARVSL